MEEFEKEVETTLELSKWCNILASAITFLLTFSPFIVFFLLIYIESFVYGFSGLIITYIGTGIIISKIRVVSLDYKSSELGYRTYEIVKIYLSKNYC